jgi:hypothetical protein
MRDINSRSALLLPLHYGRADGVQVAVEADDVVAHVVDAALDQLFEFLVRDGKQLSNLLNWAGVIDDATIAWARRYLHGQGCEFARH